MNILIYSRILMVPTPLFFSYKACAVFSVFLSRLTVQSFRNNLILLEKIKVSENKHI
jgi:hypothetical protein